MLKLVLVWAQKIILMVEPELSLPLSLLESLLPKWLEDLLKLVMPLVQLPLVYSAGDYHLLEYIPHLLLFQMEVALILPAECRATHEINSLIMWSASCWREKTVAVQVSTNPVGVLRLPLELVYKLLLPPDLLGPWVVSWTHAQLGLELAQFHSEMEARRESSNVEIRTNCKITHYHTVK